MDARTVDELISPAFEGIKMSNLSQAIRMSALSKIYRLWVGNELKLNPDGSFSPSTAFPKEFLPLVEAIRINSLTPEQLLENEKRWGEQIKIMTERGVKDILWYRQLFRDLYQVLVRELDAGPLTGDKAKEFLSVTGLIAAALAEIFYHVSQQKAGLLKYILGIDDNGRVYQKSLPGIDLKDVEALLEWLDGLFNLANSAVTFYWLSPAHLATLVRDGEKWVYLNPSRQYPVIPNGFEISDQFIRFGHEHKRYFTDRPYEVLIRAGDIETITVIDLAPVQGVMYKVKHADGTIALGQIHKESEEAQEYTFIAADFPARGWTDGIWYLAEWQGLFALVAAIARDMFVCEEIHKFYKEKGRKDGSAKERPKKDILIRWIPRFKIIYHPELGDKISEDLIDRIIQVAPCHVSGHIRKVQTPSLGQLELARQFGVVVPTGYTFVRPHERGGYEAHRTLWKSRSAVRTIFGAP